MKPVTLGSVWSCFSKAPRYQIPVTQTEDIYIPTTKKQVQLCLSLQKRGGFLRWYICRYMHAENGNFFQLTIVQGFSKQCNLDQNSVLSYCK